MKERFDRIDRKLDEIDEKLDDHLERLTVAETSIEFIKGHLKISLSVAISIIGVVTYAYFKTKGLLP